MTKSPDVIALPAIGRAVLAAGVLALGLYAGSQSLALAVRQSANQLASRLAPDNARIKAARAETLANGSTNAEQWARAIVPARAALLRDPLLPSAAATLGFEAGLRGDAAAARRAFTYSKSISRRELKTHLWEIEYSVAQNDVAGALRSYDLALRTSRQAPDILFPTLALAIADADVRRALLPILLKRPTWARGFVNHVANSSPDPAAAAVLFAQLRTHGFAFPNGAEASLLGALVTKRNYAALRRYLVAGSEPSVLRASRYPRFERNPAPPSPFDWNMQTDSGVEASIQQGDEGGVFVFSAVTGAGGAVLRQLHLLPPGQYEIVSRLVALEPADAAPFWTVQCIDGSQVARVQVSGPDGSAQHVSGKFDVPANCPAQWLVLNVKPSDAVGGVTGEINFAQIRPVGSQSR